MKLVPSRLLAGLILLAAALGLSAPAASAGTIVTYTFSGVTLLGGGGVTGSFVYDDTLHTITGANLVTAGNGSGVEANVFKFYETTIHYAGGDQLLISNTASHVEHIVFAGVGLQMGEVGTYAIGTSGQIGSYIYQTTPTVYGNITGGSIIGVRTTVPESASTLALAGLAVIGLVAVQRRRALA
ncbi:MAG: hypothetical protein NTV51_17030 [Verrucomicrobia bacterium]|nr:hypothetical protein [Verrucomicrobiota bacterium]